MEPKEQGYTLPIITALLLVGVAVSGFRPFDRATWLMEVAPVLIILPVLWATRRPT